MPIIEIHSTYRKQGGRFYTVSEVSDDAVKIYAYGGGFNMSVPMVSFLENFQKEDIPNDFQQGLFTLDGLDYNVTGWHNPESRWNGWLMPFITLDECVKILEIDKAILIETDYGFMCPHPEFDDIGLLQCSRVGYEDYYYIDGFCWETGDMISRVGDTLPSVDGEHYQWLQPTATDDGLRFLKIAGEEFSLSELLFDTEEDAIKAITSEDWGVSPEDAAELTLVKVNKTIVHNPFNKYETKYHTPFNSVEDEIKRIMEGK